MEMTQATEIEEIAEQIKPFLAGYEPMVKSAVLAELLSLLLAGFVVPGERKQTERLRERVLEAHCELVRALTKVNAEMLGTDQ